MTTHDIIATEDAHQIPTYAKLPIAIVRGAGRFVWDTDGKRYLDYYGGHCVTALGHCPPEVVEAVKDQADELLFYSNAVYNPTRARAVACLAEVAPEGLRHVFLCNSGTEANETALKLARTWTGKTSILAMEGSFHGRTLGSLAATWPEKYRAPYRDVLPPATFVPFGDADAVEAVLAERDDIAAVLLEPIQWSGMWTAPTAYFERLRALCDAHGAVLVFDEVQTGVGRTGTFSISESIGVRPDLISMAKSLGSGLPAGATFVSDAIAATVKPGDQGTTFGGGMLAMAAVEATIRVLQKQDLMPQTLHVFDRIRTALADVVEEVRGQGCLIGLDLGRPVKGVLAELRERGVLAGSTVHPHVVRLMPPYNTTDEEIDLFTSTFRAALEAVPADEVEA